MPTENEPMVAQRDLGARATIGVTVYWVIAAVQFILGLFGLRLLLSSFYPIFAVMQSLELFDFQKAQLYGFIRPEMDIAYMQQQYVGLILTLVAAIVILMAIGAFAGMNSRIPLKEKKTLILSLAKSYAIIAAISGIASLAVLFLLQAAA